MRNGLITWGVVASARNRALACLGIIALGFLWTGSSYISQMYRLEAYFAPAAIDDIVLGWSYLAQAAGLGLYAWLVWHKPGIGASRRFFVGILLGDGMLVILALVARSAAAVLGLGIGMNLLHGVVAGAYLTWLAAFAPAKWRGRIFGIAYAIGSLGTYFLSLVANGTLVRTSYSIPVYLLFIAGNVCLVLACDEPPFTQAENSAPCKNELLPILAMLVLMAIISSVGNRFQYADLSEHKVSLEMARAFYAFGLVAQGFATDVDRRLGAVLALVSLTFPFVQMLMWKLASLATLTWSLGYFVLGFFAVFRAVTLVDAGAQIPGRLALAGLGLCAGRLGEACSRLVPQTVVDEPLLGSVVILGLFAVVAALFFLHYVKTHAPTKDTLSRPDEDARWESFTERYDLSRREAEVCRLVCQNLSNSEISGALFVSESTVKFHVGNILRKTDCANRGQVQKLFREFV